MNVLKIIQRHLRSGTRGANATADVHGVIATNVGRGGSRTHLSSRSRHRIVQRGGHTVVDEHEHEIEH
jgi:hypothetical protein